MEVEPFGFEVDEGHDWQTYAVESGWIYHVKSRAWRRLAKDGTLVSLRSIKGTELAADLFDDGEFVERYANGDDALKAANAIAEHRFGWANY